MNENPFAEFNQALRDLQKVVRELHSDALETNHTMAKAINDSHLRSALGLLREDIFLRRLIDKQTHSNY